MVAAMSRTIRKRKAARMASAFQAGMRAAPVSRPIYQAPRRSTGELKFFDGTKANTNASSAGSIFNDSIVAGIIEGTGESERVGRKVVIQAVQLSGQVLLAPKTTANTTTDRVRIIVYQDKQTNKLTAATTDILSGGPTIDSFRNLTSTGRFVILADKRFSISAMAAAATTTTTFTSMEVSKPFSLYKKVNIPLEYVASAGVVADLTTNNVGVMVLSDQSNTSVSYKWRVRYTDV